MNRVMRVMKSMSVIPLSLLLLLFLLLLSLIIIPSSTEATPNYLISDCTNTTFPANSLYKANLKTLLNSLSTHVAKTHSGFYVTSSGTTTTKDVVYGFYLCRGDQNASSCADCVTTAATTDLPNVYCPTSKVAVIWYDECTVRYSNESLIGKMEVDPNEEFINAKGYNGNTTLFKDVMFQTMNSLVAPTANNQSGMKFTTKMVNVSKSDTLYAMEQCAPDLSAADCTRCLNKAISRLQIKNGARTLQPSCHVRYETYPFYNGAVNYSASIPSPLIIPHRKSKTSATKVIAIVVPATILSLALLAVTLYCVIAKPKKKDNAPVDEAVGTGEDFTTIDSLQYDLAALRLATNNFSSENKLGEGGFGSVYKGVLTSGEVVAVKRLSVTSGQGATEFRNELLLLAKLQHRNLARILGFCLSGDEKLLVYEFAPNKSLDNLLFDPITQERMNWGVRYNIIQGIARGMLYLHQDSRLRIIHRDLKASNVLLDANMNPKISDFGMARIFGGDQTQSNTSRVVGTFGYMSPEYVMHGRFSMKSDMYSFGVLILEILSGKRNSSFYESGYAEDLISYAWKLWEEGKPLTLVDPIIRASCSSQEVMRCINLGLLCVQESVDARPSIETVVLSLDSYSVTLPIPRQPSFSGKIPRESELGKMMVSQQSSSVDNSLPASVNDVSVSEMEPR